MSERIESLKRLVEQAYYCKARHFVSTPVRETFNSEVVWEGVIGTFELGGHATASRCCAFQFVQNNKPEIKTVHGVPGIDSPHKALRAALAASAK